MMDKCRINIAIVEPSDIVYEGLTNMLLKLKTHYFVYRLSGIEDFGMSRLREQINVAVINPSAILNKSGEFVKLKKSLPHINWLALLYSYYDGDIMAKFDAFIHINDTVQSIINKIENASEKCHCAEAIHDDLSERETEVLVQLVNGLSNKEIADKLNISIHTVISHRKNIIEKTGIKSLPGLTIYAISKKITRLDAD
jgi:DNA-binding CsgD family transcriptional regulator